MLTNVVVRAELPQELRTNIEEVMGHRLSEEHVFTKAEWRKFSPSFRKEIEAHFIENEPKPEPPKADPQRSAQLLAVKEALEKYVQSGLDDHAPANMRTFREYALRNNLSAPPNWLGWKPPDIDACVRQNSLCYGGVDRLIWRVVEQPKFEPPAPKAPTPEPPKPEPPAEPAEKPESWQLPITATADMMRKADKRAIEDLLKRLRAAQK